MSISRLSKASAGMCLLAVGLLGAGSPFVGTWKQNAAKSKLEGTGLGPNATVHIEQDGGGLKIAVEATMQGQPANFTYQATLDGKPVKVTGSPAIDELSTKRVTDHTFTATGKKDGKTIFTDRRVVSADGKTMTISRSGTNPEGKQYKALMVLEKQ